MANTSVIVIPEGKICDYVDGKFRNDTPEEYVRQTVVTIKATGDSVFCFEQDGYDIDVLRQQSGFIGLTQRQKEQCEECYRELTPYHITSVLASGEATKQMGAYNFINDAGKISEAIIIILYMLRCCLAHGDISPDESANEVYKYAYEVLCAPLRKLK